MEPLAAVTSSTNTPNQIIQEINLHGYQEYACQRIIDTPKSALFMEMGLGKTLTTLTAIDRLRASGEVRKVLVIAPLRVAEDTWAREVGKWGFHLSVSKVLGTEAKRREALKTQADIYVINRENVPWIVEYYLLQKVGWPFDMVVIDELSSFKSPSSKRFKALKKIRPLIKRVVGLTGTPTPNSLLDLWAQIYLLDGGDRLGSSMTRYQDEYFVPGRKNGHIVYEWRLKAGAQNKIQNKISDIVVSMRAKDFLTLPKRITIETPVPLPDKAKKLYNDLEQDLLIPFDGADVTAETAAVLANKLHQMANGRIYDENKAARVVHDAKLDSLEDIVEASLGKPILVFYWYKHDLEAILERFPNAQTLDKPEQIERWNNKQIPLLLAHPASVGHGLNLQEGGRHIVWYSLTWSLELYEQANARLDRQGQVERPIIQHLISEGTIDEDIMKALRRKAVGQNALMEAVRARLKR